MKLIVGLGNPGERYKNNRHNIGFMVLDRLAEKMCGNFKKEVKFNGELVELRVKGERTILLKPLTYMNLSGNSVRAVVDYYKISVENIIVIYDDLDIETGKLRIRTTGSAGGQKGMASIIEKLATTEISRFRMGISKPHFQSVPDYVLSDFSKEERAIIEDVVELATEALDLYINGETIANVMNKYNKK